MEAVRNNFGLRHIILHCLNMGLGGIYGNGLDFIRGCPESPPESFKHISPFAVSDGRNWPGMRVQGQCQMLMARSDPDLITGDPLNPVEFWLGEALTGIPLLDVPHHILAEPKVPGNIEHGQISAKFKYVNFKEETSRVNSKFETRRIISRKELLCRSVLRMSV